MAQDNGKSNTRRQIDENLRRAYEQTLREAVPEKLMSLLRELRAQQDGRDER